MTLIAVTDKTAPARGIFKVELIYAIGPQKTRQPGTKAGLTMSHDIHIASPKRLHKNMLTAKSKEASSDLTSGHASRPYKRLGSYISY